MKIGTVTGPLKTGRTLDSLEALRFVQVDTLTGSVVAADLAGAGKGDRVLLATGEAALRCCMGAPVDAAVVAVLAQE